MSEPQEFYLRKINFYEQLLKNIQLSPYLDDFSKTELICYFTHQCDLCYIAAGLELSHYKKVDENQGLVSLKN